MLGTCTWFTQTFALIGTYKIQEIKLQCVSLKKKGIYSWIFFKFNIFPGICIYMFATLCIH